MKNWILLLVVALTATIGCDVIDNPIKDTGTQPPPDTSITVVRKIVIEDYTGHRCKNCPKAAKALKDIEALYGERIVAVAVHAGPTIFTGTTPDFPTDFTTPEGDVLKNFFGVFALPIGMVNRVDYSTSGLVHLKPFNSWADIATNYIDSVAVIDLRQEVSYSAADSSVVVDVEAIMLKEFQDDLKVCVMLLESGIVAPQLMEDDTRNPDYVHNHVLRDMFTDALGDELALTPILQNDTATSQFNGTLRASLWEPSECDVVTFIFNARTYEILQAEVSPVVP
jgi:hypothetical protein